MSTDGPPPNCNCKRPLPAATFTVKKDGPNQGRLFYTCRERACDYFAWADTPESTITITTTTTVTKVSLQEQGSLKRKLPASFNRGQQPPTNKKFSSRYSGDTGYSGNTYSGNNGSSGSSGNPFWKNPHQSSMAEITLSLAGKDAFNAHPSKFIAGEFQKVEGYKYDPKTRLWTYPLTSYQKFLKHFQSLPRVVVHPLPDSVIELARTGQAKDSQADQSRYEEIMKKHLPQKLTERLMGFQKEGILTALKMDGRILIGDEMGLGKTVQALGIAKIYELEWPVLIVCPSSLRFTWAKEIENWLEIGRDRIDVILNSRQAPRKGSDFCIVSYDLMSRGDHLIDFPYKIIIADESHYLKSRDSKRSKAVCAMLKNARRAILLSGTPAMSRPMELFPQLNALNKNLFPNYHQFGLRYCNARLTGYGWDYTGAGNLPELYLTMTNTVLVRRLKSEVLAQLPDKRRQVVYVQPDPMVLKDIQAAQQRLMEINKKEREEGGGEFDEEAYMLDFSMAKVEGTEKRGLMIKMYHKTGAAKLPAVLEYLGDVLENDEAKAIVFAHHMDCLDGVSQYLFKNSVDYVRIDGSTPQTARQTLCDRFQETPACRVALLGITSAGVGLTLTAANLVIFAELYWTPAQLLQGEDRAHRIGQKDCVDVKYLLAEGTVDEKLWPILKKKLEVVGESIDGIKGKMDSDDPKKAKAVVKAEPPNTSEETTRTISDLFKQQQQQTSAGEASSSSSSRNAVAKKEEEEEEDCEEYAYDPLPDNFFEKEEELVLSQQSLQATQEPDSPPSSQGSASSQSTQPSVLPNARSFDSTLSTQPSFEGNDDALDEKDADDELLAGLIDDDDDDDDDDE